MKKRKKHPPVNTPRTGCPICHRAVTRLGMITHFLVKHRR